jgi:hypothetical protein
MKYAKKVVCLLIVFANQMYATPDANQRRTTMRCVIQAVAGLMLCSTAKRSGRSIVDMLKNIQANKGLAFLMQQSERTAYHLICSATTAGTGMVLINQGAQGLTERYNSLFLLEIVNEQLKTAPKMPQDRRFKN